MKRFVYIILALPLFFNSCGMLNNTMSTSQYLGGYWGQWKELSQWSFYGNPGEFVVYRRGSHPSDFCYRVTLTGFNKWSLKDGEWRNYDGWVEYHSIYTRPYRYKESSQYFVQYDVPSLGKSGDQLVKRPAKIKVQKKKSGYTYNVFFDDVGFAVTVPWQNAK